MTPEPNSPHPRNRKGRGPGWAALILGILICLGVLSSVANGTSSATSGAAETAGLVIGRLIMLAIGITAIVFGVRRLSRR